MHVQIVGMTESGKTTLATRLAKAHKTAGFGVLVLDPMGDSRWTCDYQSQDRFEFLNVVKSSQRCFVFVDESGVNVGNHDSEMFWLATQSRHWGHSVTFIAQRSQQIAKTVRDQCGKLFLFACSFTDAKILADEYNRDELRQAHTLQKGEYFAVSRFGPVQRLKLSGF